MPLTRRRFIQNASASALTVLGTSSTLAATTARPTNVLLIMVDDLNDWVGCLGGHPQAQTPNIDRLAAGGRLFANAHCAGPICNPARAAMLTGKHPATTGLHLLAPLFRQTESLKDAITLPQHLMQHGYRSLGVGKVFHQRHDQRSYHAFGGKRGEYGPMPDAKLSYPHGHPLWDWGAFPESEQDTPDYKIADWAIERLGKEYDQPLFLSVGFYRPHVPMYAPQRWFDLYPEDRVQLPPLRPEGDDGISEYARQLTAATTAPRHDVVVELDQWRHAVRSYLASVSFMDHQVGRVLQALEQSPHAGNTVVVFCADHGFHLGEKRRWGKRSLWEESTHIPMIIAGPGITPGRCDQPVGSIDLYPTLTRYLGLTPRPGLDGHDLTPLLNNPAADWDHTALTSFGPGNHAVRSRRWRYIRYRSGDEELYDHDADPREWNNLADKPAYRPIIAQHQRHLPQQEATLVPNSAGGDCPLLP